MPATRTRWLVGVICVLALVAAACGGSGNGGAAAALPECLTFEDLYALTGPESEGVDSWADAQALATELGSTTELPDEPLRITGPGEESGTYNSYVEIALAGIAEERAAQGFIGEDQVETTRKDYESSPNDNVIVESISGSNGSLGWAGFAFADLNSDSVRSLRVDGGQGCVSATIETIADASYPLSRPLFIYVNTDRATASPAVAGFVDFYLSDEGRASVSEADYVELDDDAWQETKDRWSAAGIAAPGGDVSGTVAVSGSSTVEPISGLVAEKYRAENPGLSISVAGPGTSDGIEQFCNGEIDVADASRAIKEPEVEKCRQNGVEFVELRIGIDGIAIITRA